MRFTIAFITLLTLWAALAVQTFLGHRKEMHLKMQQVQSRARAEEAAARTAKLKGQNLDTKIIRFSRQLTEQERLLENLRSTFEEAALQLSELMPEEDKLSIRSLPVLGEPNRNAYHFLFSIPEDWLVGMQIRLEDRELADSVTEISPLLFGEAFEFDGELPKTLPLSSGSHKVELITQGKAGKEHAYFLAVVDGMENCRLTATSADTSEVAVNAMSWREQKDYSKTKLPRLLKVFIEGTETTIWVQLVNLDSPMQETNDK